MHIPSWITKIGAWAWKKLFEKKGAATQSISTKGPLTMQQSPLTIQTLGDHSSNLNVRDVHLHQGVSFTEVEKIAMTLWRSNFPQLRQEAMNEAERRVRSFLSQLEPKLVRHLAPTEFARFRTPEIQYSFHQATQTAALRDEPEINDLLCDLIVAKVREQVPTMESIVYSEAIKTLSMLTTEMVNMLAVHYCVRSARLANVERLSDFAQPFNRDILPLLTFSATRNQVEHLVYAGCGTFQGTIFLADFLHYFIPHYPKVFQDPICRADAESKLGRERLLQHIEMFDELADGRLRFRLESAAELDAYLLAREIMGDARNPFTQLFHQAFRKLDECRAMLLSEVPQFEALFKKWPKGCPLSSFQVTPVGNTLGQARLASLSEPEQQWIPEKRRDSFY